MEKYKSQFPPNFLWGASTSAHQVEGDNHNQWSVWELENAKALAKTAAQRLDWLPVWEQIKDQAQDPDNYISGKGIDHYRRYKADFDLAKGLNLNALRFGVEWARLEPKQGKWNQEAVNHYKKYIQELRKRGIEPVLNIWHWTNPVWFEELGGFKKRDNLKYFDRFVQKVASELTDDVTYVITLNEPNVYVTHSYGLGFWPPQEKNWLSASLVYLNLIKAHKRAYRILKDHDPQLMIGVAPQLANVQQKRPQNIVDLVSTKTMRYFWNWWYLNRIRRQQDFIGFNHYFSDYYKNTKIDNPEVPKNDLGWYMEPEGLHPLLTRVWAHYRKPILITENGVADMDDKYRKWWIEESVIAMERALSEGVQVVGYMHWSLLDNFEWAYGWWPKFGLIGVDRENGMKREVKQSAKYYARTIRYISKG